MAKDSDTTTRKSGNALKSVGASVLLGLLVLGLAGFGIGNYGSSITAIGTVGDREISTDEYARALRQETDRFSQQVGQPLTVQQAIAFGLDRSVLQSLVDKAALDNEAARIGISLGDAAVAQQITAIPAFQNGGAFDRAAYRGALERNGYTEVEFEDGLRRDSARALLQGAVSGGYAAPAAATDALYRWAGERRGFSMLRLTEADLPAPVAEPTEDEITAFYEANVADRFTRAEAKRIRYAALLPEAIAKDQPVDEADLQALYQTRIDEFVIPESRLVEQLVYPTQAEADAAKARLDAGESFDTLVADRGLTIADIDLGDVTKADLGPAGDAVFALTEPGVTGPVTSALGPAIYRLNGILPGQETSFEEARDTLATELQTEEARRVIEGKVEAIDDLLASGGDLEALEAEVGMTLGTLDFRASSANDDPIADYAAFREAGISLAEGDFPEAILLENGGIVAMEFVETVPPAPIPLAEAREDVIAGWREEALTKALGARAVEAKAAVEAGGSLSAFGIVDVTAALGRGTPVPNAPTDLADTVFALAEGELRVVEAPGFTALLQLDSIQPADADGPQAQALREAIAAQFEQAIAEDALAAFTEGLANSAGIAFDQAAINAVNVQLQ